MPLLQRFDDSLGARKLKQGVANINPDKIGTTVTWQYSDKGSVRLGSTTLRDRTINPGKSSFESTKGYTLFDLNSTYKTAWGDLTLGVENLTNKFYILTSSQVAGFQNYASGRGRVVSISHSIKFH